MRNVAQDKNQSPHPFPQASRWSKMNDLSPIKTSKGATSPPFHGGEGEKRRSTRATVSGSPTPSEQRSHLSPSLSPISWRRGRKRRSTRATVSGSRAPKKVHGFNGEHFRGRHASVSDGIYQERRRMLTRQWRQPKWV